MAEHLFGISLTTYSVPLPIVTDTAVPVVPVYYIHSFEQPFCADATCICHTSQPETVRLFVKIIEGHLELEQAASFIDDSQNGRK